MVGERDSRGGLFIGGVSRKNGLVAGRRLCTAVRAFIRFRRARLRGGGRKPPSCSPGDKHPTRGEILSLTAYRFSRRSVA